ncbi:MAG: outer membrane protein assembly factor BamD [Tidjanibacter sp.]|nr:outer membrane protein assembly factor BamD [Tidjanibacter sp.]
MKKQFLYIAAALLAMLVSVGCSSYSKLLKVNDSEQMYVAALDYYRAGNFTRALELFEQIAPRYSGTMRADSIMYFTGCSYYKQGDFMTSAEIFDTYRRTYGRSPMLEDVEYMYAMGFYFAAPDAKRDQSSTRQAIAAISEYMSHYPESPKTALCEVRIEELRQKLFEKSYINARTYYKTERYKSAIIALRNALTDYPDTPYREEILYLTAVSCYRLADNSIASLQTDRFLDMMDAYYNFISEFPDSNHRRELDRMQRNAKNYLARHNAGRTDESSEPAAEQTNIINQ